MLLLRLEMCSIVAVLLMLLALLYAAAVLLCFLQLFLGRFDCCCYCLYGVLLLLLGRWLLLLT